MLRKEIERLEKKERRRIAHTYIKANKEVVSAKIARLINLDKPDLEIPYTDIEIRAYKAWITMKKRKFLDDKKKRLDDI